MEPPLVFFFKKKKSCSNIAFSYLFSATAFNALIGAQAVCMIISFGIDRLPDIVMDKRPLTKLQAHLR